MANPLPVSSFSTDACPPAERHELWRNRDWPAIGPVFDTQPLGAFHNRADSFRLRDVVVHVSDMAGQVYRRDPVHVRKDGFDQLLVTIPVSGTMSGDSDGRSVRSGRGMLAVTDLTRPHRHVSSDSRTIMLTIPRAAAMAAHFDIDTLHGFAADGAAVNLLRAHVEMIHENASRLTADQAATLGESVMLLLRMALRGGGGLAPEGAVPDEEAQGLLWRARHVIGQNLGSPALNVKWLCRELNVSRSVLYRLFEPLGGVADYIRGKRLAAARDYLGDIRVHDSIAGIAERFGFADPAHFSRAFRAQFGSSPRAFRDNARLGADVERQHWDD